MSEIHDPRLKISAVRERYNNPSWFSLIDKWHRFTAQSIFREICNALCQIPKELDCVILNIGAGGNDFGLNKHTVINLDISDSLILKMSNPVVATAELLPIEDNCVNFILCVGSVINYCDAALVIAEFGRVMRSNGTLILEFESSYSAELITQSAFRQSAAIAETFYASHDEVVWVYSPQYINNLLSAAGFNVLRSVPIHILSPWLLLLSQSPEIATIISPIDRLLKDAPFLSRWASNHLIFCEKRI